MFLYSLAMILLIISILIYKRVLAKSIAYGEKLEVENNHRKAFMMSKGLEVEFLSVNRRLEIPEKDSLFRNVIKKPW